MLTRRDALFGTAAALTVAAFDKSSNARGFLQERTDLLLRARELREKHHAFLAISDQGVSNVRDGPLSGITVSVKDDLFTKDLLTTGGSQAFSEFKPVDDAVPIARLRHAGVDVFAKCNLAEFAMHVRPRSPLGGECLNPIDRSRTAGGSSGGSATAIAAGVGDASIATDSGGSIRGPAAFCGVIGFCPSNGKVPKIGSFGTNLFFTGIGSFTRTVDLTAKLHSHMAGYDRTDPETLPARDELDLGATHGGSQPPRFAWVATFDPQCPPDIDVLKITRDSAQQISQGSTSSSLQQETIDMSPYRAAFGVISDADRLAQMERAGSLKQQHLFSAETRERLDQARKRTGSEYSLAMYERGLASLYCSEIFQKYDFILSPTVPMVAPRIAEIEGSADFARRYLSNLWWTNFVGCPAITIPAGVGSDGLPIGLQIVGRPDDDDNLLRIAAQAVKALS